MNRDYGGVGTEFSLECLSSYPVELHIFVTGKFANFA